MTDLKNSELLALSGSNNVLTSIDRQRCYVLRMLSHKNACPNCATPLDFFQAAGIAVDDLDLHKSNTSEPCACPSCKRGLLYVQPLMGDWRWALVPVVLSHDHQRRWSVPKHPGDRVRTAELIRGDERGFVCIQDYGTSVRVGAFLPGSIVDLPGDTPKVEPEKSIWCTTADSANERFDEYVEAAALDGWQAYETVGARAS